MICEEKCLTAERRGKMFLEYNKDTVSNSDITVKGGICWYCENACWLACTGCEGCQGCKGGCGGSCVNQLR